MRTLRSIKTPQVAVGAIIVKDGKILLVKRTKAPHKDLWAIPGGSVELGETLQAAAEREVREETGLSVKAKEPIYTFDLIERDEKGTVRYHFVIVDLTAEYISGELTPADDALDARWLAPAELKDTSLSESTRQLLFQIGFLA